MKRAVPILMYHQVAPRPTPEFRRYAITPRTFAAQMRWLSVAGYRSISLDALLNRGGGALPPRPVVITFDDGIDGCLEYVAPTLAARGLTAIFYLVAGLVGGTSRWTRPELGVELPLMDWNGVRTLESAGFRLGSHTMTHPRLTTLSPAACRDELYSSRRLLEDRLGHEIAHLAYPFGAFDDGVRRLTADAGYRTACSTRPGLSPHDDDPLALHRVTIYGHESLLDFACRLWTGRRVRDFFRDRLRRAPTASGNRPAPHIAA